PEPTFSPLSQSLCYLHDIEWARGLNTTDLYAYKQYLQFVEGTPARPPLAEIPAVESLKNQQLLDLLGVRYVVCPADMALPVRGSKGWQPVQLLKDNRVYLLSNAPAGGIYRLPPFMMYKRQKDLPRAFITSRAEPLPDVGGQFQALSRADLHRTVLLDSPRG